MSDLDPAHVEAVARAMIEVAYYDIAVEFSLTFLPTGDNRAVVPPHWEGDALVKAEHYARALLAAAATDSDVSAALLAALVQAGVLSEDRRTLDDGWASQAVASDGTVTNSGRAWPFNVTRWEDA